MSTTADFVDDEPEGDPLATLLRARGWLDPTAVEALRTELSEVAAEADLLRSRLAFAAVDALTAPEGGGT